MTTYAALLRAINVAGHGRLAMSDLRSLFIDLGHRDVATHLQSGNVIFTSAIAGAELAAGIEQRLEAKLGTPVAVLLRTAGQLAAIAARNRFLDEVDDPRTLHVTFLAERADQACVDALDTSSFAPDRFDVRDREVYLHCPHGYGRTKLNNAFWERRLQTVATTRNWNTVTRLVQLTGSS